MSSTLHNMKKEGDNNKDRFKMGTQENLGRSMGRIEAFLEAGEMVANSIDKISNLATDPRDRAFIINALLKLSLDITKKV